MKRLLVFADLHGSLSGWLTIKALLGKTDGLVVAGDLFDVKYGNYASQDFRPEEIRSDLASLGAPFFYVYGNCDVPSFFPGYDPQLTFDAFGKTVFLHHGHRPLPENCQADVIIQGHTHQAFLGKQGHRILLNPGSMVLPRGSRPAYGIIDETGVSLVALATGLPLKTLSFS